MTEIILSNKKHGMLVLLLTIVLYILAVLGTIFFADEAQIAPLVLCILYLSLGWLPLLGLKVLGPQEALVLTPVSYTHLIVDIQMDITWALYRRGGLMSRYPNGYQWRNYGIL